jgi:hypothetical protein
MKQIFAAVAGVALMLQFHAPGLFVAVVAFCASLDFIINERRTP